jgi:DNA-binding beta-propeller fold protein YncE
VRKPEHTAKVPSISTGNSAATACSRHGRGRSAPTLRLLVLLALSLAALFAIAAPSALAARGHVESSQVIGKPCVEVVCGEEELKEPSAVAVDEATNQVYVLDQGNARVLIFNAETGAQEGEFDGSETPAGAFAFESPDFPVRPLNGVLAVDNSCHLRGLTELTTPTCAEADPSDEDVYVIDTYHHVIDKFTPDGEYLGQITEGPEGSFPSNLEGVAVSPLGRLWVLQENSVLTSYSNQEPNVYVGPQVVAETEGRFPEGGLAIDAEGNFYVRVLRYEYEIGKFSPAGHLLIERVGPGEATGVAADPAGGSTLIDAATTLGAFNAEGNEIEHFGFGGELHEGAGIGIDSASGYAYVADSSAGHLLVLAPSQPGPPVVESSEQSVTGVGSAEAELHSAVNPQSEEGEEATTWAFQYGPCPSLGLCPTSPFPSATPAGTLPADFASHPVAAALTGLEPSTTYHFRVLAHNSLGEAVPGAEGTFTTEAPGGELLLPDGRAWEMVSPTQKDGAVLEPLNPNGVTEAAADGSAITYLTRTPTEADPAGNSNSSQIISTRGPAGWSTRDVALPHIGATGFAVDENPEFKFFTPDLSLAAVQPFGEFNPALSPEASESTPYLDDIGPSCTGSCLSPLVSGAPGFANVPPGTHFGEEGTCRPQAPPVTAHVVCGPQLLDATPDLGHLILSSTAALTAGGVENAARNLYEWSAGTLAPVSVLPDGEPAAEPVLGTETTAGAAGNARGALSQNGSRVVWSSTDADSQHLYLRDLVLGQTIALDGAEPGCAGCESGGATFQIAAADTSRVFFTDDHKLTEDSGAAPTGEHADLYECRIVETGGELGCDLTDLTPLHAGEPAQVKGTVLGGAEDGSRVYFVAEGVLSEAPNPLGRSAVAGRPNLYVVAEGQTRFIATLGVADAAVWGLTSTGSGGGRALPRIPVRVSPDGRWLTFMSQGSPTGYDNDDAAAGEPVAEVYLYEAATDRLLCPSCLPGGGRPTGIEYHRLEVGVGGISGGEDLWEKTAPVAAVLPSWTSTNAVPKRPRYQPPYLDDSGRLFFNSYDPLVPQDSNGTVDVYQWEPPGVGGCTEAGETFDARSGGCVDLISSGTSGRESAFLGASGSGDDVFFITDSRLSGRDTDNGLDVYDAHACSAASPCLAEPAAAPEACKGEACQSPPAAPAVASPTSQSFAGPGNVVDCRKGQVRKSGKCVKRHHKKNKKSKGKHHKKKVHKPTAKSKNRNRDAGGDR